MPDLLREDTPRELTLLRKHKESNSILAIVMAGIAGLFIVTIVAAYNYATTDTVSLNQSPPASASAPATRSPTETTGSGSSAPPQQAAPDKSMKQQ